MDAGEYPGGNPRLTTRDGGRSAEFCGMKRAEFSRGNKDKAYELAEGNCQGCGRKLRGGPYTGAVEFDHIIPCEQGGNNDIGNCRVLCAPCHGDKTRLDLTVIAKSRHVRQKFIGARRSRGLGS